MYNFDIDFQTGILSLMAKDAKFLSYSSAHLKPSFFDTKEMSWMFSTLRDFYMNYRCCITSRSLKNYAKKARLNKQVEKEDIQAIKSLYDEMTSDTMKDRTYIIDSVAEFVRHELLVEAFEKSKAAFKKESYEEIPGIFSNALYTSSYIGNSGQFYPNVDNFKQRMMRRKAKLDTIPTGIPALDCYLRDGGLGVKELGIILAPTSRGKSMFLKHIAEHNLRKGKNSLIFTLEMSEDRYLDRFDMSLAGVLATEFKDKEKHIEGVLLEKEKEFTGKLHIKEYGAKTATVSKLIAYTESLKNGGFFPDFIIVDYADELASETSYSDVRHNISHVYRMLRGWAMESNLPIWTASQANRSSITKKTVDTNDISEDFSKAMTADVILSLCQTNDEHDNSQMRIFVAKNRDSPAKVEATIDTNFHYGRFYAGIETD